MVEQGSAVPPGLGPVAAPVVLLLSWVEVRPRQKSSTASGAAVISDPGH